MSEQNRRKLNHLDQALPEGLLVDAGWLEARGYYPSLRKKYVDLGWLEQPARRVYRRPRGSLGWEQAVISLQTLLACPVAVGGRTALELQGFAHYLTHTPFEVYLHGRHPPPTWLNKLPLGIQFTFRKTTRLFPKDPPGRGLSSLEPRADDAASTSFPDLVLKPWGHWDWPLALSTPERAILEMLDELPANESFLQADALMDGLSGLRPRRLQVLLEACASVKVRRLFLYFADRHGHAWLKYIDRDRVDLGNGKRMLVRGGKLDPTYNITVPADMHALP